MTNIKKLKEISDDELCDFLDHVLENEYHEEVNPEHNSTWDRIYENWLRGDEVI